MIRAIRPKSWRVRLFQTCGPRLRTRRHSTTTTADPIVDNHKGCGLELSIHDKEVDVGQRSESSVIDYCLAYNTENSPAK